MKLSKKKYILSGVVVAAVILIDQFTKHVILRHLDPGDSIEVIRNFFNITLIYNPGAAFGIFADLDEKIRVPFFMFSPFITLSVVMYAFFRLPANLRSNVIGLALIIGGAIGNLADRYRIGHVIDFLDFHWHYGYHFPAFNVADSAITIGVVILVFSLFLETLNERHFELQN